MHATAFALGIHEDTGSLTYASTTHRDVEALAACVRLGRQPGAARPLPARPASADQRELLRRLDAARTEREIAGLRVVTAAAHAGEYVEDVSSLVSRVGDVADWDVLFLSRRDGGTGARRRRAAARPRWRSTRRSRRSGEAGTRRPPPRSSARRTRTAVLERVVAEAARVARSRRCGAAT